ncbi:MAG: cell division protein ZapD [Gammaproteobacteria bacterium]|nr:cell division protein ZapD [Gammaproteobacteria bacterium]
MSDLIHFEFPLTERIRLLMRLEQLFLQMEYFRNGNSSWDARALIDTFLEILNVLTRNDVKSELLKELDKNSIMLEKLSENQHVNSSALNQLLDRVNHVRRELSEVKGKIGGSIIKHDFLQSIALRSPIPGGKFGFDLPWFQRWLEQTSEQRQDDIQTWVDSLSEIQLGIDLLMNMLRGSTVPEEVLAMGGFFQATLDQSRPYQLIRASIDNSLPVFPEISGGKHRFTIRFLSKSVERRPVLIEEDIEFRLTKCLL